MTGVDLPNLSARDHNTPPRRKLTHKAKADATDGSDDLDDRHRAEDKQR